MKGNSSALHHFKVVIIGNTAVGKSSLLKLYQKNEVDLQTQSTLGSDFFMVPETVDGQSMKLIIWDTAGQERYRAMTTNNLKNSKGVVVVYSIADRKSFEDVERWIDDVVGSCSNYALVLIGNKTDLIDQRVVSYEEGKMLAQKFKVPFYETSVLFEKRGPNSVAVKDVFQDLAKRMLQIEESMPKEDKGKSLNSGPPAAADGCKC